MLTITERPAKLSRHKLAKLKARRAAGWTIPPTELEPLTDDDLVKLGYGVSRAIDRSGDKREIWDPRIPDEVESARQTWQHLVVEKRYAAFRVTEDGSKGEQVREFVPDAGKLIYVKPIVGG